MTSVLLDDFDPGPNEADRWWKAWDAASKLPEATSIHLAEHSYLFTKRLVLPRRLDLVGEGQGRTFVVFSAIGDAGINVAAGCAESLISSFSLYGPNPWDGADDGICVSSPFVRLEHLRILNWSARGAYVHGSVQAQSNANNLQGNNVRFDLCGHGYAKIGQPNPTGSAAYFQGGDANGATLLTWSAFDCRKGFLDHSFLGNTWVACHAEGCTTKFDLQPSPVVGLGFETLDPNCRSAFLGCYTESDSPASILYPSVIVGGFMGNVGNAVQIGPHGGVQKLGAQHVYDDPKVNGAKRIATTIMGGNQPGDALSVQVQDGNGSNVYLRHVLRFGQSIAGWWSLNYGNLNLSDTFRFKQHNFWIPFDSQHGLPNQDHGMRKAVRTSLAVVGAPQDGGAWRVGDRLDVTDVAIGSPCSYVMTADGWKVCARVEP